MPRKFPTQALGRRIKVFETKPCPVRGWAQTADHRADALDRREQDRHGLQTAGLLIWPQQGDVQRCKMVGFHFF